MNCFGTTDFDNNTRLITLSAIIISGLHCTWLQNFILLLINCIGVTLKVLTVLSNLIQYYSWGELYCRDFGIIFFLINVTGIEKTTVWRMVEKDWGGRWTSWVHWLEQKSNISCYLNFHGTYACLVMIYWVNLPLLSAAFKGYFHWNVFKRSESLQLLLIISPGTLFVVPLSIYSIWNIHWGL